MTARILIIEDEMLVALEMEAVIEDLGHHPVGIAPDFAAALELGKLEPDVALVDLNLRDGLTGPKIAERLIDDHGTSVIFITANPRLVAGGVPGAFGVVEKPIDDEALDAAITYALSRRAGAPAAAPRGMIAFA